MILGLQAIALIFSLIMVYFAYLHFRRKEISTFEMSFWLIAWVGAIFITLFPNIFGEFAKTIAISRAFDLAVIGGFILVVPLVYISYIKTKRLEKKLEEYVREEALDKIGKKNRN